MLKEFYTLRLKLSRSIVVMGWLSSGEAGGGGDLSDGVGGRTRGINNQSLLLSKRYY